MRILVSGLVNIETNLKVREFPINYFPIDFPFFGIKSDVSGVAYNIAKALTTLGDKVDMVSYIGNDAEGDRVLAELKKQHISDSNIIKELKETPTTIVLYDETGRRQIYCDLKDLQDTVFDTTRISEEIEKSDIVAACNTNYNRSLLHSAKAAGKIIATDVHVLSDINDEYNKEFMECADILFFSDESLPCAPEEFIDRLKDKYNCKIMVIGMGKKGAFLYDREADKKFMLEAVHTDNVVNTVGAGDSLFSAFIHFYAKGFSPVEALKRAQIFASKKIGFNGAANGFCTEGEIEKAYAEC